MNKYNIDISYKILQIIRIKLVRYDINLVHIPAKKLFIKDSLSHTCTCVLFQQIRK